MRTVIQIKVIPNAAKNQIEEWREGVLRIRIHAVPEKGKANGALIAFLAEKLQIAKSAIQILSGQSGRLKRVAISGLTKEEIEKMLNLLLGS